MSSSADDQIPKTPQQKLAELVALKKAAAGKGGPAGLPGQRQAERGAAARSASKSKPANRK